MRHPLTQKKKSWFYSPAVAVVLCLFVVWGGVAVIRAYAKQREAVMNRNASARELAEVRKKQAELSSNIENLSTGRGLEAEVRNRYRVAKPGEQLVIVVDNGAHDAPTAKKPSLWTKMRQFVGF